MIHGSYSDQQIVTLADGRSGIITRSLGHQVMAGKRPDDSRGPQYEVLLNGRQIIRDGRAEWHGEAYVLVEELADHSLEIISA